MKPKSVTVCKTPFPLDDAMIAIEIQGATKNCQRCVYLTPTEAIVLAQQILDDVLRTQRFKITEGKA